MPPRMPPNGCDGCGCQRSYTESSGPFKNKKTANPKDSRTSAERNAPHWEAPNGPPGGHFRAEEASPENLNYTLPGLSLVGLGTDKGRNFEIVLIVGEIFLAGVVRTMATLCHGFTLEQIRRTACLLYTSHAFSRTVGQPCAVRSGLASRYRGHCGLAHCGRILQANHHTLP